MAGAGAGAAIVEKYLVDVVRHIVSSVCDGTCNFRRGTWGIR